MYSASVVAPAGRGELQLGKLMSGGHVVVGQQTFTTTSIVVVVAHCPASGVKVYVSVPSLAVEIVGGDHVPDIPFVDVPANASGESPMQ